MTGIEPKNFIMPSVEEKLRERILKLNSNGRDIPTCIDEILGFPYESFEALKEALANKDAQLLRFSFEYLGSIAQALNPSPQWRINVFIAYFLPLISVGLAIFYSWWFIFGLVFFFVGASRTKKLYNNTIFNAAMNNELAFSFLFYARQVSVANSDRSVQHYYDPDNSEAKTLGG